MALPHRVSKGFEKFLLTASCFVGHTTLNLILIGRGDRDVQNKQNC
jgi:hypothetical protein